MAMLTPKDLYTEGNVPKTTCLVLELSRDGDTPVFTLAMEKEGYISLQKLFIDLTVDDPTEIEFAEQVFGDVVYWINWSNSPRLKPHLDKWRQVAEMKRKQIAFKAMVNEVRNDGKGSLQAARFLIEEPWKNKRLKKVREQSNKTTEQAHNSVSSDLKRLEEFIN